MLGTGDKTQETENLTLNILAVGPFLSRAVGFSSSFPAGRVAGSGAFSALIPVRGNVRRHYALFSLHYSLPGKFALTDHFVDFKLNEVLTVTRRPHNEYSFSVEGGPKPIICEFESLVLQAREIPCRSRVKIFPLELWSLFLIILSQIIEKM